MPPTGQALKRTGMAAASVAAGPWNKAADEVILELARSGAEFTSEDITSRVGQPPSSGAVGARMNAAARRRWIERVGYDEARRPNQHAAMLSRWRGLEPPSSTPPSPRAIARARQASPSAPVKSAFETMPLYQCHYCHEYLSADELGHEPGPPGSGVIWRVHRPPCYSEEVPA